MSMIRRPPVAVGRFPVRDLLTLPDWASVLAGTAELDAARCPGHTSARWSTRPSSCRRRAAAADRGQPAGRRAGPAHVRGPAGRRRGRRDRLRRRGDLGRGAAGAGGRRRTVGLPLLEVPRATPFLAITRAVAQAINRRELAANDYLMHAQRSLTAAAVGRGGLAAVAGRGAPADRRLGAAAEPRRRGAGPAHPRTPSSTAPRCVPTWQVAGRPRAASLVARVGTGRRHGRRNGPGCRTPRSGCSR